MKELINYGDFEKLDIRAGLIAEATAPEWSEKLIRYVVDFGEEFGKRVLFSGIRQWYIPEELVGKKVPVILNMAHKKMGKEFSEGMVLMVDSTEKPIMIFLPDSVELGAMVR